MSKTYSKQDILQGGPGLDGYAFCADVYCTDCARKIVAEMDQEVFDEMDFQATDKVPQPIFFGESDSAQHCADCGEYLYGEYLYGER